MSEITAFESTEQRVNAVQETIHSYRPRAISGERWIAMQAFVTSVVSEIEPSSAANAYVYLRVTARFVDWCLEQDLPLSVEVVFTEANVERFMEVGANFLGKHSRASFRSALRRVGRAATRRAEWSPQPRAHRRRALTPPYRRSEIERFIEVAHQQRTVVRRRAACGLLALGYGAGLESRDLIIVEAKDVAITGSGLAVTVKGRKPRQVPVLPRAAPLLEWLVENYPERPLLSDRDPARRTMLADAMRKVVLPTDVPPLDLRRLRTTWLTEMLSMDLRISEVMALSGLSGTHKISELLDYIPKRPPEVVHNTVWLHRTKP